MAILISLSGLPGVGKTTLARELAAQTGAIHLRVDSVETALKNSALKICCPEDGGYLVLASIAKDNLSLGIDVIMDTVNPLEITRQLWRETATGGGSSLLNIEIICSDLDIHRKRVEERKSDIEGHIIPNWDDVIDRYFEAWGNDRLVVDTAHQRIDESVVEILKALAVV